MKVKFIKTYQSISITQDLRGLTNSLDLDRQKEIIKMEADAVGVLVTTTTIKVIVPWTNIIQAMMLDEAPEKPTKSSK